MPISFKEFLKRKAEASGWSDRNKRRSDWLTALNQMFDQIRGWLRESDPDGLIEVVPYKVERVEQRLGIYDAPALKLRLDTDSVDILPVGRYVAKQLALQNLQGIAENSRRWGDLSNGRVDVTDGERRYQLLRSIEDGQDRWYVWKDNPPTPFDRSCFETILLDLMS